MYVADGKNPISGYHHYHHLHPNIITNTEDKPKVASSQEILENVPRQNSALNMENLITPYLRFFIYKIGKNNYWFFSI